MKKYYFIFIVLSCIFVSFTAKAVTSPPNVAGIMFSGRQNNQWNIFIFVPARNILIKFTNDNYAEGNPVFWKRNNIILCSIAENEDSGFSIAAFALSGKKLWQSKNKYSVGWPVPSPYDNRILAVRQTPDNYTTPGVINYPNTDFIPFKGQNIPGGQTAWLSSTTVLLSRRIENGFDLYKRNLNTNKETLIVHGGVNWQSVTSPYADFALFVRRVGSIGSIFKLYKNNQNIYEYENLTNAKYYDWQPSFGPTGEYFVYQSLINGRFANVVQNIKTHQKYIVTIPGFQKIFHPTILDKVTVNRILVAKHRGQ